MSEAQVLDKFRGCMMFGMGLSGDRVNGFADRIMKLEEVDDVSDPVRLVPDASDVRQLPERDMILDAPATLARFVQSKRGPHDASRAVAFFCNQTVSTERKR